MLGTSPSNQDELEAVGCGRLSLSRCLRNHYLPLHPSTGELKAQQGGFAHWSPYREQRRAETQANRGRKRDTGVLSSSLTTSSGPRHAAFL